MKTQKLGRPSAHTNTLEYGQHIHRKRIDSKTVENGAEKCICRVGADI